MPPLLLVCCVKRLVPRLGTLPTALAPERSQDSSTRAGNQVEGTSAYPQQLQWEPQDTTSDAGRKALQRPAQGAGACSHLVQSPAEARTGRKGLLKHGALPCRGMHRAQSLAHTWCIALQWLTHGAEAPSSHTHPPPLQSLPLLKAAQHTA